MEPLTLAQQVLAGGAAPASSIRPTLPPGVTALVVAVFVTSSIGAVVILADQDVPSNVTMFFAPLRLEVPPDPSAS